jgi:hypothetical protein
MQLADASLKKMLAEVAASADKAAACITSERLMLLVRSCC